MKYNLLPVNPYTGKCLTYVKSQMGDSMFDIVFLGIIRELSTDQTVSYGSKKAIVFSQYNYRVVVNGSQRHSQHVRRYVLRLHSLHFKFEIHEDTKLIRVDSVSWP